jgi:hypothetical protein
LSVGWIIFTTDTEHHATHGYTFNRKVGTNEPAR